jgi:hypothetical protein
VGLGVEPNAVLLDAASRLHWMACRWVVDHADSPVHALICDDAALLCAAIEVHFDDGRGNLRDEPPVLALEARRSKYGREHVRVAYTLPVTLEDAVVILHRYARRFAHGRSTHAARRCNGITQILLDAGVDLSATEAEDGTLWAEEPAVPPITPAPRIDGTPAGSATSATSVATAPHDCPGSAASS